MEELVARISQFDPFWVYVTILVFAYVENIIPPLPSDFVVVAAGSMIGMGKVDFGVALAITSIGSTVGFMTMYKIGDWFGDRILESGRMRFIPLEQVHRVEGWFRKYGFWVVVANRFLAGTRAVVAFFVGMSELPFLKTIVFSFVSSVAWNAILLYGGKELGENWRQIFVYLKLYGEITTFGLVAFVIVLVARSFMKNQNSKRQSPAGSTAQEDDRV